ncbi:MAG: xanthine dehydrogenase accessory factor [Bradymonadia bacterium]|jgi:xanthine dehydrogenase accessory factor
MVVLSGRVLGTIGGGIMEENVIQTARRMLAEPPCSPRRQELQHHDRASTPSGLFCAGEQTNVWLSLGPTDAASLATGLERGELFAGPEGISDARPDAEWSERIELVLGDRALIIGAGHCGQALARQLRLLAWDVVLLDPRSSVSTVVSGEKITPVAGYSRVHEHLNPSTAAVVMTPSFGTDVEALTSLLSAVDRPPFIGLMGSTAKKHRIEKRLAEVGLSLEGVHCPVGLEMRSETPEEIAVSVAGQLLRWSR